MIRKDTVEKILPLSNFWLRLVASFVFVLAGLTGNAALAAVPPHQMAVLIIAHGIIF